MKIYGILVLLPLAFSWALLKTDHIGNEARAQAQQSTMDFSFQLDARYTTSAAVYGSDGQLVRTLWKGQVLAAGDHKASWDLLDDYGKAVAAGDYRIKLIHHNVEYIWEGVIGNSSKNQLGTRLHRSLVFASSMAVVDDSRIFYAPLEPEQQASFFVFDPANAQEPIPHYENRSGGAVKKMATDGEFLFQAIPGVAWNNPDETWVIARQLTDMSQVKFSAGRELCNHYNAGGDCAKEHYFPSVIDWMRSPSGHNHDIEPTGLEVQRSGNFLFVAHGGIDSLHVLDKRSGALVHAAAINDAGDMASEAQGNGLWVIQTVEGRPTVKNYKVDDKGILHEQKTIKGLSQPLALALSPRDETLVIVDGGDSQQVKAFDPKTGERLWTLGQYSGFRKTPDAAHDRFDFTSSQWSFIEFQPDGSFWVASAGDRRMIQFSATREHLQTIQYQAGTYVMAVDSGDPTRVFSEWLEFKVNYSKPLGGTNGSWTYVRNWGPQMPEEFNSRGSFWPTGGHSIRTLATGDTYAAAHGTSGDHAVFRLTPHGAVDTGFRGEQAAGGLYPDGALRTSRREEDTLVIREYPKTGINSWGPASIVARAPAPTGNEPFWANSLVFYRLPESSQGILTSFREQGLGDPFHLGGIKRGETQWHFKASRDTSSTANPPWQGDFPIQGTRGVSYQGHLHDGLGRNIVFIYHGESWNNGQANQFMHFLDNGMFVGQFGVPNSPAFLDARYGTAGNATTLGLVEVNGETYLWHNDESNHGGLHRWRLAGVKDIRVQTGVGKPGETISLTADNNPIR